MAFLSKKSVLVVSGLSASAILILTFQNCGKTVQFSSAKNLKSLSLASTDASNSGSSGSSSLPSAGAGTNTGTTGSGASSTGNSTTAPVVTQPTPVVQPPAPVVSQPVPVIQQPAPVITPVAPVVPAYTGNCGSETNDADLRLLKTYRTFTTIINGQVPLTNVCSSLFGDRKKTVQEVGSIYYYIMSGNTNSGICDEQIDVRGSALNTKSIQISQACLSRLQECNTYYITFYDPVTRLPLSSGSNPFSLVDFGPTTPPAAITVKNGEVHMWKKAQIAYKRLGGPGTADYTTPNAHLNHPGCDMSGFYQ